MNKIVSRTDNVNFTTEKNAEEGAKMISRFHALVNLSKFALCSEPERANAVQRIKYALRNYECTDGQRMVLQGVMSILEIKPDNVMPVKRDSMKAIKINLDGVVRYSTIKEINKYGFCYLSDKASAFIRAQSLDNNVYDGTEPIFPQLGITGKESTSTIFATINGDVCYYYIKGPVYDDKNPFAPAKEGEWQWQRVELSVIDIME